MKERKAFAFGELLNKLGQSLGHAQGAELLCDPYDGSIQLMFGHKQFSWVQILLRPSEPIVATSYECAAKKLARHFNDGNYVFVDGDIIGNDDKRIAEFLIEMDLLA